MAREPSGYLKRRCLALVTFDCSRPRMWVTIPKSEFPPGVKVGGQLQGVGNDGQPAVFNVVKIKGPEVHLDGNHPLAGQALKFSCKVTAVRAATAEEIAHRHVHGAHGHQH